MKEPPPAICFSQVLPATPGARKMKDEALRISPPSVSGRSRKRRWLITVPDVGSVRADQRRFRRNGHLLLHLPDLEADIHARRLAHLHRDRIAKIGLKPACCTVMA